MQNFFQLANNVDVVPLLHAVMRQPELWNQHTWRTTYEGTPHAGSNGNGVSDIWLRYSDPEKTASVHQLEAVLQDMRPVFYPAWNALPQARPIILDLMRRVEGYELGRVLVTKLEPGGEILPHSDNYGDYVYSGARYHVVLQGKPGSLFHCGDECVNMQTGSVWWFNHKEMHSVQNNSSESRIHLLVDMRLF